jgi:hypothetical protein
MKSKPVKFALADGAASLKIALPGGYELDLAAGKQIETCDPREIAALDAHPSAKRAAAKKKKPAAKKPAAAKPAAPSADVETAKEPSE